MHMKATITRIEEAGDVYDIGYQASPDSQVALGNAMWVPKKDAIKSVFDAARIGSQIEVETTGDNAHSRITAIKIDGILATRLNN
jgi:hypothetical protein